MEDDIVETTQAVAVHRNLLIHWLPLVAYAGLIFYLSSLPQEDVIPLMPPFFEVLGDKALHAVEYGILGVLWYRAFLYAAGPRAARSALLLAILASIGYGLSDEIHQAFVPTREADVWDVLADSLGACLATIGWRWGVEP